jgi:membrane dipeptidase
VTVASDQPEPTVVSPQPDELMVIDGLTVARWSPSIFRALNRGRICATNATCAIWEGTSETLQSLGRWHKWFDVYADQIVSVRSTADILLAHESHRTGIILGFQNAEPISDCIEYLSVFKQLGVGIIQLTYNSRNRVGSGCYDRHDEGLSGFGHDVVVEMNRLGIAIDLSHVGTRTCADAIKSSTQPVVFSHVVPREIHPHPRNKELGLLRAAVDKGGLVCGTMFPAFLPRGAKSTVDDFVCVLGWLVNELGEDNVGYGSDFTQGQPVGWFEWISRDQGSGEPLTDLGTPQPLAGIRRLQETPNIVAAMRRAQWPLQRIQKVIGLNWLNFFRTVWQET